MQKVNAKQQIIRNILRVLINVFNENDVEYWLDCGTLLGAIRDNDVIFWDDDGDISIFHSESHKVAALLPQIVHHGTINMVECWFDGAFKCRCHSAHVDVYPWVLDGHKYRHVQSSFAVPGGPQEELESFEYIEFLGTQARVPKLFHQRLTRFYGDYNTPIRADNGYWSGTNKRVVNKQGKCI
jgi:phosphorylcholine metabolism protein LicD